MHHAGNTHKMHSELIQQWPVAAKWLHLALLLSVTFQMITGLSGWIGSFFPFTWHILVGLCLMLVLGLQWGWLLMTSIGRSTLRYLFPWSPRGLRLVIMDVKGLTQGLLTSSGPRPGLPGFMHGIFLFSVTIVALTGFTLLGAFRGWWSGVPFGTLLTALRYGTLVVAAQWLGHVGMVLLHALIGDPLWEMFRLKRAKSQ